MARETSRQDRSPRQASGARSASGGRAGAGTSGSKERTSRGQSASGARTGGAASQGGESARRQPSGGQRESMSASGTQASTSGRQQRTAGAQSAGSGRPGSTANSRESSPQAQSDTTREREQSIQSGREIGAPQSQGSSGIARSRGTSPVRGPGAAGTSMGSNPFLLMQRMAEDMDRLFEQFGLGRTGLGASPAFASLLGPETWRGASRLGQADQTLWSPRVDVRQRGDDLVIRADLPGVKREDVHVEVEHDVLTIRGERREEHEEEGEGFYRSERSYGRFHRALPLPEGVNADQREATFKDGVLEITLPAPKPQEQRARRIEVR